ncbi:hypothetical protein A2394_00490 [Candidatus Woesebacteria bacterium RIFOXYB1_FULL_42_36]|uniref:Uncharacterized protein n=3 Tax=Candidatus Woeseibacteriota TaxID=1752722 RepID=A0A837IK30_9BACT|nr:MAG: hypothetical protein UW20_C0004G0050 [Candidatus Woesebacteria bacterium GW2011_GWB1_44_11]KKT54382.1 MAG: hypothetical protein UW47_C0006G0030 [Candidatus Woesebacteria bacterium GW2011_GWA1_44_23]OGM75850.1 MAG: hypothetical protein A2208_01740 [Candidatus Woesebacteria bacterium RIFOXYA1_FULL_43_16]OGM83350.1 MAG: hypothetical protein A2394_00490 [Candidatus Woesebacteria bacterium RIFOXYB1_FULL_42_36]OGM84526.1 MAG: hypothetical protein A2421_00840 [Candidatus Woesebacteria bacteriu
MKFLDLILVEGLGFIEANICESGFAYDAEGNTYQMQNGRWIKVCCSKKEVSLSQSRGDAPMSGRHSVPIGR